jgi:histone deacetylase 1/2
MQTDWGGEYEKLRGFFQKIGITHHVSCPHAHQQNEFAKCKHHHILEVGLALLAHASMPLKFWDETFLTAPFSSITFPVKLLILILLQSAFLVLPQTMMIYVFLVGLAGQTCVPITKVNLLSVLIDVCFLDTVHITKVSNVLILPLVVFTFPEMLFLMRSFFPLPV